VAVNPVKFGIELLDRVGRRAEHAESAAPAYFCDHIPAVAEREDRISNTEFS
jgi:hypothetical protein